MGNVVRFPRSPSAIQAEAEEQLRMEFRMNTAVAAGIMTKRPTAEDIIQTRDRMADALKALDDLIAIRMACQ